MDVILSKNIISCYKYSLKWTPFLQQILPQKNESIISLCLLIKYTINSCRNNNK